MDLDLSGLIYTASTWVIPVLLAVTLHEAAHGFVAHSMGDDTAYRRGRVTLNPFKHVDPFGTVILPALLLILRAPFLFGWAKPVPVAFGNLRPRRAGLILVAAAGPGANLILATISALLMQVLWILPDAGMAWAGQTLWNSIILNLVLAVFNMIPVPPLDGGRVAVGLLPLPLARRYARLEKYGLLIIIGAIFLLPFIGSRLGYDLDIFTWVVWTPVSWMLPFFQGLAGLA